MVDAVGGESEDGQELAPDEEYARVQVGRSAATTHGLQSVGE